MRLTYKKILPIIIPTLSLQFSEFGNAAIDGIMIGHYNPLALGGVVIANMTFYFAFTLFIGIVLTVSPLIGHAFGAKSFRLVIRTVRTGACLAFLFSIAIVLLMGFMGSIARNLGLSGITLTSFVLYMNARRWGSFMLVSMPYRFFLTNQKQFTPVIAVSIATLPLNIFLNWVFIYGKLGMVPLGVTGAGFATSLSAAISAVIIVAITSVYARKWRPSLWTRFYKIDFGIARRILKYGIWLGITLAIEISIFAISSIMSAKFDANTGSAFAVVMQMASLCYGLILGTCDGMSIFIAIEAGKGNRSNILRGIVATMTVLTIITLSIAALIHFFPLTAFDLFLNTKSYAYPYIIRPLISVSSLIILYVIIENCVQLQTQILRSLNDTKYLPIIQGIGYLVIAPSTIYMLDYHYNYQLRGILWGIIIGMASTACLLVLRVKYRLKEQHVFEKIET